MVNRRKRVRLNGQHELFALAYALGATTTAAAEAAGYQSDQADTKKRSDNLCRIGSRLLASPLIQERIEKIRERVVKQAVEKVANSAARVLEEASEHIAGDVRDLFDANGKLLDVKKMSRRAAIQIQAIRFDKDGNPESLTLVPRLRALELYGKHIDVNAFRENVHHSGSISHEEALAELESEEDD